MRCRYSSRSSSRLADEEFEQLELAQPHKTGHRSSAVSSSNASNCSRIDIGSRLAIRLDASLGIDESRGTKPLDRGCRGKDSAGASALGYEATGDILVRHRHLGFSEQPFLQLARTTSGEGAEAVEPRNSARCSCRVSSRAA